MLRSGCASRRHAGSRIPKFETDEPPLVYKSDSSGWQPRNAQSYVTTSRVAFTVGRSVRGRAHAPRGGPVRSWPRPCASWREKAKNNKDATRHNEAQFEPKTREHRRLGRMSGFPRILQTGHDYLFGSHETTLTLTLDSNGLLDSNGAGLCRVVA